MYWISETFHGFVHTMQALWVHYVVADYVAEDGMDDLCIHAAFVACHYDLLSGGGQGDTGTSLDASMGPRLFSRGNGGHFSASVDLEKLAVFERFFNSRGVFSEVRLSSREFSLFGGVSSAPRSSRNHITSRKASRY
jgi:hypothetical protein